MNQNFDNKNDQRVDQNFEQRQAIVALDVGTTKVCTIIAFAESENNNNFEIVGMGSHPSHGLKKGSVINIGKTVSSINSSIEEASLMSGVEIEQAIVGIAGSHIYSFNSSGVVAIKSKEISKEDVNRVIEAAKAVMIPADREVLHVIPQEFKVDTISGIKNPIGMCGVRLEVRVHIVTGAVSLIQNLVKCVEQTGIKVSQLSLQPIASSESVLTSDEKEVGVVLVDIGGGTTDIAVWKDGSLIHSQIIPVGGNHFTNDLAVALRVTHAESERIKINHGSVLPTKFNHETHISINKVGEQKNGEVLMSMVANVLGLRAEELFSIIKVSLQDKDLWKEINGGVVLTGGGSLIDGLSQLGEFFLERSVKIGYPISKSGMSKVMQSPQFSTALGLLNLVKANEIDDLPGRSKIKNSRNKKNMKNNMDITLGLNDNNINNTSDLLGRLSDSLKHVFREIF